MKAIQDAVTAYLQKATGVRAIAHRTRVAGEYPLLAVAVREDGTVLVDGGRQAEHTYRVTVTAASDRDRESPPAGRPGAAWRRWRGTCRGCAGSR